MDVPVAAAFSPFPDLSFQAVTGEVPVIVDESAASNHKEHPGISTGRKGRFVGIKYLPGEGALATETFHFWPRYCSTS